jgi:hypothetical protein
MLTTGRRDCRCSTAGLLVVLSHLYPEYMLVFLYLLILDFASHWYHMYSARGHHKVVSADRNFLLRFYYGVRRQRALLHPSLRAQVRAGGAHPGH